MSKRVMIIGGGFGGIYAALRLEKLLKRRSDIEVILITRDNYFLFTPMLHEVAAAELGVDTIINPLHKLLRRVSTFIGTVDRIDIKTRRVSATHGLDGHAHELHYDHLILALGSGTNFFNLPGVEEFAVTMKSLTDAIELRNRIITHLEEANSECAAGEREPLLTFVVAGGGFAGVETLGAINDFIREALAFHPNLKMEFVRTVLVTPEHAVLSELSPKLGAYAQRKLAARGVEIITGARVTGVHHGVVELDTGHKIEANTLIWTAGTAPNPLVASLPIPMRNGKIAVNEYLEVPDSKVSGRSETALWCRIVGAEDFIHPRHNTLCAKGGRWRIMSRRRFWVEKKDRFVSRPWGSLRRSVAGRESRTSSA